MGGGKPLRDSGPTLRKGPRCGTRVRDTGLQSVLRAPLLWLWRPQRLPHRRPAGLVDVRAQPH